MKTPRQIILEILKSNNIKAMTKKEQTHQGMGYFMRGGRDVNRYEINIFVDNVEKAKELIKEDLLSSYEQYCIVRYGCIDSIAFKKLKR